MSRLDNLGDYNIVRDDLYKCGGDVAKLYKSIGDTAVAEQTPALLTKGGVIGGAIVLTIMICTQGVIRGVRYMKERAKMLDEKPNLEQQLVEHMEKSSSPVASAPGDADGKDVTIKED